MKKDTETKRVQVTLPLELYQALQQQAQEELRSVPAQIRQILKANLGAADWDSFYCGVCRDRRAPQ